MNKKLFSIGDLSVHSIVLNHELLNSYTMKELDSFYKKYYGDYSHYYPIILTEKIKAYDSSDAVNSFLFKGQSMWLDKATRVGLMHLANCSTSNLQVVLADEILTLSVEKVKEFLTRLEVYAGQCYLQTQKHIQAVKELNNAEDFINYDYTTGYPEKIVLE